MSLPTSTTKEALYAHEALDLVRAELVGTLQELYELRPTWGHLPTFLAVQRLRADGHVELAPTGVCDVRIRLVTREEGER